MPVETAGPTEAPLLISAPGSSGRHVFGSMKWMNAGLPKTAERSLIFDPGTHCVFGLPISLAQSAYCCKSSDEGASADAATFIGSCLLPLQWFKNASYIAATSLLSPALAGLVGAATPDGANARVAANDTNRIESRCMIPPDTRPWRLTLSRPRIGAYAPDVQLSAVLGQA